MPGERRLRCPDHLARIAYQLLVMYFGDGLQETIQQAAIVALVSAQFYTEQVEEGLQGRLNALKAAALQGLRE